MHAAEGWINPKIWELRNNERETPNHIVNYLQRWKDTKGREEFSRECDAINVTQSQEAGRPRVGALPALYQ